MRKSTTSEFKIIPLRETAAPSTRPFGDSPDKITDYWRQQIATGLTYSPTVENAAVVFLNTRRRITGHTHLATGTIDTLLVHPRDFFMSAILHNAAAVVFCHNHPSGDPTPSEADVKVSLDLARAGDLLRIQVLDSVVIGHPAEGKGYSSLRELGFITN